MFTSVCSQMALTVNCYSIKWHLSSIQSSRLVPEVSSNRGTPFSFPEYTAEIVSKMMLISFIIFFHNLDFQLKTLKKLL